VAVPYIAALLEQSIRLVEQEDPPALLDRSDPHVLLCELRVLSQDLALECVALLASHRRDVQRIVRGGDILHCLFRPTMDPGDPRVGRSVRTVRVTGPDASEIGGHDLVSVLLELARRLVAERLAPRLRPG
jgi:hypothetical protein